MNTDWQRVRQVQAVLSRPSPDERATLTLASAQKAAVMAMPTLIAMLRAQGKFAEAEAAVCRAARIRVSPAPPRFLQEPKSKTIQQ